MKGKRAKLELRRVMNKLSEGNVDHMLQRYRECESGFLRTELRRVERRLGEKNYGKKSLRLKKRVKWMKENNTMMQYKRLIAIRGLSDKVVSSIFEHSLWNEFFLPHLAATQIAFLTVLHRSNQPIFGEVFIQRTVGILRLVFLLLEDEKSLSPTADCQKRFRQFNTSTLLTRSEQLGSEHQLSMLKAIARNAADLLSYSYQFDLTTHNLFFLLIAFLKPPQNTPLTSSSIFSLSLLVRLVKLAAPKIKAEEPEDFVKIVKALDLSSYPTPPSQLSQRYRFLKMDIKDLGKRGNGVERFEFLRMWVRKCSKSMRKVEVPLVEGGGFGLLDCSLSSLVYFDSKYGTQRKMNNITLEELSGNKINSSFKPLFYISTPPTKSLMAKISDFKHKPHKKNVNIASPFLPPDSLSLLEVASQLRMTSDLQRTVFVAIVGSLNAEHALQRLENFLKPRNLATVAAVIVELGIRESPLNPFYISLAQILVRQGKPVGSQIAREFSKLVITRISDMGTDTQTKIIQTGAFFSALVEAKVVEFNLIRFAVNSTAVVQSRQFIQTVRNSLSSEALASGLASCSKMTDVVNELSSSLL